MNRRLLERVGPVLGLVFVSIIFGLLVGSNFFRGANLELIARQTAIVCVAALGMTMVIVSGGIDLSVGSVVSLTTVIIVFGVAAVTVVPSLALLYTLSQRQALEPYGASSEASSPRQ